MDNHEIIAKINLSSPYGTMLDDPNKEFISECDKLTNEETKLYMCLPWVNGELSRQIDTKRIKKIRDRLDEIDTELTKLKTKQEKKFRK